MTVLTLEELIKAKHDAESLGLPMRAAFLGECIDTNTFNWGFDPREVSEKEATEQLKKLRAPSFTSEPETAPDIIVLPN